MRRIWRHWIGLLIGSLCLVVAALAAGIVAPRVNADWQQVNVRQIALGTEAQVEGLSISIVEGAC